MLFRSELNEGQKYDFDFDHQFIETGTRASMPHPAPKPENAPKDHTNQWLMLYVGGFWLAVIIITILIIRRKNHAKKEH